jgi:hypothetical protein
MEVLFEGTRNMLAIAGACIGFVILAMIIDLISGVYKARQRGEVRTSYGLSRTVGKFILYSGSVIIAMMIDLMLHYSHLMILMKLAPLVGVPVVTCLLSVFLCIIEIKSIRERADEKTNKDVNEVARMLVELIGRERLRDMIATKADDTINGRYP